MSYGVQGISGGVASTGAVVGGFTLSLPGDFGVIILEQGGPQGTDNAGQIFLGGTNTGEQLYLEQCFTVPYKSNLWAANWIPVFGASRSDLPTPVVSPFSIAAAAQIVIQPANLAGVFAVRIRLGNITSGSVIMDGSFSPMGTAAATLALQAAITQANNINLAQVLALCDQTGQDYIGLASGYTYP